MTYIAGVEKSNNKKKNPPTINYLLIIAIISHNSRTPLFVNSMKSEKKTKKTRRMANEETVWINGLNFLIFYSSRPMYVWMIFV